VNRLRLPELGAEDFQDNAFVLEIEEGGDITGVLDGLVFFDAAHQGTDVPDGIDDGDVVEREGAQGHAFSEAGIVAEEGIDVSFGALKNAGDDAFDELVEVVNGTALGLVGDSGEFDETGIDEDAGIGEIIVERAIEEAGAGISGFQQASDGEVVGLAGFCSDELEEILSVHELALRAMCLVKDEECRLIPVKK